MRLEGAAAAMTCDGIGSCIWRGWVAEVRGESEVWFDFAC